MKKNLQTKFSTRQYMLSKDFEIYYYNDVNIKSVGTHTHDYYEFYFFINGEVAIEISGEETRLVPGDIILIPPKVPHQPIFYDPSVPYQRFIFWISQDYCNQLLQQSPDYVYLMQHAKTHKKYIYHFDVFTFKALQSKVFSLIEELHSNRFGKDTRISLCVNDLIFSLNRAAHELDNPSLPKEQQSICQNIISYIDTHLDEDLSLDQLAKEFFVSKYYISHAFKEQFGLSLHQFILKKRLTMCQNAILSHTDISEAYHLCGFNDYSSFFRAFKKEYGMSPKEFKELYEQEQ